MNPDNQSDEALMDQVVRGDRSSMEILVRRFSIPMLAYLRNFLGDDYIAEEVFQEVFLTVWEKRHQFRKHASFRPWLFAIGANKSREHFRRDRYRSSKGRAEHALEVEDKMRSPVDSVVQAEDAQAVKAALNELTEQQRSIVIMRVWSGLSYADIAAALGVREGAIRVGMHRALERLRPTLSRLCDPA